MSVPQPPQNMPPQYPIPPYRPPYPPQHPYPPQPQPQPQPGRPSAREARRIMRRAVNRPAGMVLLYVVIMQVVAELGQQIVRAAALRSGNDTMIGSGPTAVSQAVLQATGMLSLIGVAAGMLFLLPANRRMTSRRGFWIGDHGEAKRMRASWLLDFTVLLVSAQAVLLLARMLFGAMGINLTSPAMESLNAAATNWPMWLYIGLAAPVCEEIAFRGVLMRSLAPYGRNFAIVTSAFMFGLFHGDPVQGTFAFLMGLLLGFVAMEYSLVWAIALHTFNNAVLGGVLAQWATAYGNAGTTVYVAFLLGVGVIGGIVVFARHGRELAAYARANRSPHGTYWGWTAVWFLVFAALHMLTIVMMLNMIAAAQ